MYLYLLLFKEEPLMKHSVLPHLDNFTFGKYKACVLNGFFSNANQQNHSTTTRISSEAATKLLLYIMKRVTKSNMCIF